MNLIEIFTSAPDGFNGAISTRLPSELSGDGLVQYGRIVRRCHSTIQRAVNFATRTNVVVGGVWGRRIVSGAANEYCAAYDLSAVLGVVSAVQSLQAP